MVGVSEVDISKFWFLFSLLPVLTLLQASHLDDHISQNALQEIERDTWQEGLVFLLPLPPALFIHRKDEYAERKSKVSEDTFSCLSDFVFNFLVVETTSFWTVSVKKIRRGLSSYSFKGLERVGREGVSGFLCWI